MTESGENSYVPSGTLPKPGILGRSLRLMLGVVVLATAYSVGMAFQDFEDARAIPGGIGLWVVAGLLFFSMRDEIDLGLGATWGRQAQIMIAMLAVLALALDLILYGRLWAPPLGILFYTRFLVSALPLGVALILAALIGTPGCEMRSYAHVWAKLSGGDASEHYCPGGVDIIDSREARYSGHKVS